MTMHHRTATRRAPRVIALIVALSLTLVAAGCGNDDDGGGGGGDGGSDVDRQTLVDSLLSEGATEEEANCFVDELGVDEAARMYAATDEELSEDDTALLTEAFLACSEAPEGSADG